MKRLIRTATILLLSVSIVALASLAAIVSDELAKDIQAIVAITPESEKNHVDNYLRNGPAANGNTFVTAAVAKNTLNILERDERITMPLARTMIRFAQNAEYPKDTRQYAFAKLTRMAKRNKDVAALVTPLATELAKRDQDPLKRDADRYLKK
jgi:hypothetical protein